LEHSNFAEYLKSRNLIDRYEFAIDDLSSDKGKNFSLTFGKFNSTAPSVLMKYREVHAGQFELNPGALNFTINGTSA
jgi:hypothetical protein